MCGKKSALDLKEEIERDVAHLETELQKEKGGRQQLLVTVRCQQLEERLNKLNTELKDIKGTLEERLQREVVGDAKIEAGMYVPQFWSNFY